jgi:hypothetical protein|tara:strand:+ start:287 stop:460 length:174 start_codon:yes stop_codon:yes gene_type:complete
MKTVTITSKNITQKQWSNLILELNLMKQQWKPFATLDLQGQNVKKIIKYGTNVFKDK